MADEEIPRHGRVFTRGREESWYRFLNSFTLIIAGLDEKDLGAIDRKSRGKCSTSGAGSYDDVFITAQLHGAGVTLFGCPIEVVKQEQLNFQQLAYFEVPGAEATKLATIAKKLMVRRTSIAKYERRPSKVIEDLTPAV
jgi:hypothetical protein